MLHLIIDPWGVACGLLQHYFIGSHKIKGNRSASNGHLGRETNRSTQYACGSGICFLDQGVSVDCVAFVSKSIALGCIQLFFPVAYAQRIFRQVLSGKTRKVLDWSKGSWSDPAFDALFRRRRNKRTA